MKQGQDGTPFIEYFDKPHSLSFVWDGTQDDQDGEHWIDVSFGGSGEPVRTRIPWGADLATGQYPASSLLRAFALRCEAFVSLIHDIEHVDEQAHAS